MSTLARTSNSQSFRQGAKSCALHPESRGSTCEDADDPVCILGKRESKDPEFQKEYLKLIGEEPTLGRAQ